MTLDTLEKLIGANASTLMAVAAGYTATALLRPRGNLDHKNMCAPKVNFASGLAVLPHGILKTWDQGFRLKMTNC